MPIWVFFCYKMTTRKTKYFSHSFAFGNQMGWNHNKNNTVLLKSKIDFSLQSK